MYIVIETSFTNNNIEVIDEFDNEQEALLEAERLNKLVGMANLLYHVELVDSYEEGVFKLNGEILFYK